MNLARWVGVLVVVTSGRAFAEKDPAAPPPSDMREPGLEVDDCPLVPQVLDAGYVPWKGIGAEGDRREWCAAASNAAKPECFVLDQAVERYTRGGTLYLQGDYVGAINEFVQFHCLLAANPVDAYHSVLKDIGLAYERMVDYGKAIRYYQRYLVAIPPCGEREAKCKRSAELERRTMSSRIQVLQNLPSVVQVATEPPGATVTLTTAAGPEAIGRDDLPLSVAAGAYQLRVDKPGYELVEREVTIGIGRPYSYSFRLIPKRGRVRVQAVPGDAKISIDGRVVAVGLFDGELQLGEHQLSVSAAGRLPREQTIDVRMGAPTNVSIELPAPRQSGRTNLIAASTAVGGLVGLSGVGSATDDGRNAAIGLLVGAGAGALSSYFLVPDDLTLGASSLLITTTLAGFTEGALVGGLVAGDTSSQANQLQTIGAGAMIGAAIAASGAAIALSQFDPKPGDASVYNSGAVWGGVAGSLFTAIFPGSPQVQTAITLTGLNLGLLTGGLLANRYDFSRRRVIYIDLAGVAGLTVGAALAAAITSATGDESDESTAHFSLGGLAIGLGLGVYLTRYLDAPNLPTVVPQLTPGADRAGGTSWILSVSGAL